MKRIYYAIAAMLILASSAQASMRGQWVCGVPPDEAVVLTSQASNGGWVSWGPNGPISMAPARSEQGALGGFADPASFVCEVEIKLNFRRRPARFYRLGWKMNRYRETETTVFAGDSDPRSLIVGVPNTSEDLHRTQELAQQGHAPAQHNLGVQYARGQGVPQDYREALKWYRKAAQQGLAQSQYRLGMVYGWGHLGVAIDRRESAKWLRKAAEQGHAEAQLFLGSAYDMGKGVPEDDREAAMWYRKAAEQGHAKAQYSLSLRYAVGEGVPEDDREALKWLRRAAEQGHDDAQFSLGQRYSRGWGVPQDYAKAHAWFNLAAEQGNSSATRWRDEMATKMRPAQLAEAKARSAELSKRMEVAEALQDRKNHQRAPQTTTGPGDISSLTDVSGIGGAAESGPCEIRGYPRPSNPQGLGLSWCPSSVTFQVRSFALAAAGAKCAVATGSSSTPAQIQARQMEVKGYCERLKSWPGNTGCVCPPGYTGGRPQEVAAEARRQEKARRRQTAEEEARRRAAEERERRQAAEKEEMRRRAAENERLRIIKTKRDVLSSDCTCISIDNRTGEYACLDGFVGVRCDILRQ